MPLLLILPLVAGGLGVGGGYILGVKTSKAALMAVVLAILFFAYKKGVFN